MPGEHPGPGQPPRTSAHTHSDSGNAQSPFPSPLNTLPGCGSLPAIYGAQSCRYPPQSAGSAPSYLHTGLQRSRRRHRHGRGTGGMDRRPGPTFRISHPFSSSMSPRTAPQPVTAGSPSGPTPGTTGRGDRPGMPPAGPRQPDRSTSPKDSPTALALAARSPAPAVATLGHLRNDLQRPLPSGWRRRRQPGSGLTGTNPRKAERRLASATGASWCA